jgi:AcrR family transcriptional regulator
VPRIPAAQRRSDFVKAAVEVIATHGIDGATTRRIAEQAQANLAMLHYCYDSKDALFADVYDYVATTYRDVIKGNNPHDGGVAETAGRILRGVMEFYLDSPSFTATAMELISWARRQRGGRGMAVYDQALAALRDTLRQADTEHQVSPETIDEIVLVVATLADGLALNWLTYGDRSAATRQLEVAGSVLRSWLDARLVPAPAGG